MGGKAALEALLSIDPTVKAIVSSGYSNDPVMASYRQYGFCAAIPKPYRIQDLGQTLSAVLTPTEV
jgi:DNA-binding NtrC family response regulator